MRCVELLVGDCRELLKGLDTNSIDSCVTDPPYALVSVVKRFGGPNAAPAKGNEAYMRASAGFMGKKWDTGETAFSTEFWAEVYRVLKPGAFLCAFGASRGYHRMACAIEDAGFEVRDSLMWVYGSGFPKSQNVSLAIDKAAGAVGHLSKSFNMKGGGDRSDEFADNGRDFSIRHEPVTDEARTWSGFGTALKPAFEPIVLARKPLSEGTVAANVLRWRTGALNIGACLVSLAEGETPYSYPNGAGGNTFSVAKGVDGTRTEPTAGNEKGRWPANVVHDGSDEVVGAFPSVKARGNKGNSTSKHDSNIVFGKYNAIDCGESYNHEPAGTEGSAARFFYCAKASKKDRAGSKHPTIKPIALMRWLCRLITPPGGTVLDPFAGSGTTGAAALAEGFRCVLVEREAEYVADIRRRLNLSDNETQDWPDDLRAML